jgi:hypothetical protein
MTERERMFDAVAHRLRAGQSEDAIARAGYPADIVAIVKTNIAAEARLPQRHAPLNINPVQHQQLVNRVLQEPEEGYISAGSPYSAPPPPYQTPRQKPYPRVTPVVQIDPSKDRVVVSEIDYRGRPVLQFTRMCQGSYAFGFGRLKAKQLLDFADQNSPEALVETIRAFVNKYDKQGDR